MSAAPTTTDSPGRGRPREFDADEVLEKAIQLFWTQGYEATSVSDIVEATGLNKSSLYNAFGSKDELFALALQRYVDMRATMLTQVLVQGTHGLADVHSLFDLIEMETASPGGDRGCLAVNSSTELGGREESVEERSLDFRRSIRTALHAALGRAAAAGEIDAARTDAYADVLMAFLLGMSVVARSGAQQSEMREQLASMRSVVDSWRID
jgi:TetR/AcrR family transcriptional repressor of nem operon